LPGAWAEEPSARRETAKKSTKPTEAIVLSWCDVFIIDLP
jgi:hypothetical protein